MRRLKARLQADTAGIHGAGAVGETLRKDPPAKELIEFWAQPTPEKLKAIVTQSERLAQDLIAALANGDGIYNYRFHYWLGGLEMSRMLVWMDQALGSPELAAADKARLKQVAALFAAALWDNDFVPLDNSRSINLGTPNMPSQQAGYRDQYALLMVADPRMRERALAAIPRVEENLRREINEHGAHLACVHYISASMGPTLAVMQQMQQAGLTDFFRDEPRVTAFAEFLLQCATPPEPRFGGLRKQIAVGDSATESSELFGQLGAAFAGSNPDLSRRLMGMWRAQGAPHSSFHGTTLLKIDDGLPGDPPFPASASVPGYLSVLRHGAGTPRESAVWLLTGNQPVDHVHSDEGEVIIYAHGAPVSLDWGSMYEPRSAGAWMHNVALPERMFSQPWDTDSLSVEFGGDLWGNYAGTRTTIEEFHADTSGGWMRSRMLAPDKSFTWTRAVSSAAVGDDAQVVAIQDFFAGDGAAGGKVFTLNLCAEGEVETPAGRITPKLRMRGNGGHLGDRRENPSSGEVFPIAAGVNRLRFTGQSWPKHPAGGVDFDVFIVADQPQEAFIGHWAHAWHPGSEQRQFRDANGRPFEESQHILRVRGDGGFRVVLLVWPKGSEAPPARMERKDGTFALVTPRQRIHFGPGGRFKVEPGPTP